MSGWPSPGLATDAARLCGCQVAAAAAQCLGAHEGAKRREAALGATGEVSLHQRIEVSIVMGVPQNGWS